MVVKADPFNVGDAAAPELEPKVWVELLRQVNSGRHDKDGNAVVLKAGTQHHLPRGFAFALIGCNRAKEIPAPAEGAKAPEGGKGGGKDKA